MVDTDTDTRDRVIAVQTEVGQLQKTVETLGEKMDTVHSLIQQGQGAKWAVGRIGAVLGGGVGALIFTKGGVVISAVAAAFH